MLFRSFETTSRVAQDSILSTSIGEVEADLATETTSRVAEDATLLTNIGDVENDLTNEITNRINGDNNLGLQIDDVESDLSAETTSRMAENASLLSNIGDVEDDLATEISDRTNADTTLQTNINTVASNLTTEISDRTNADTTLQSNIDSINTTINGMVDDFSNQTIAGSKTFTDNIRVNGAEGINICSAGSASLGDRAFLNLFESGNAWGHQVSNDSGDDAFRITKYQSGTNYERIKIVGNGDSGVIYVYGNLSIPNNKELYYKNETLDSRFVNTGGDTMTGDLAVNGDVNITGNLIADGDSHNRLISSKTSGGTGNLIHCDNGADNVLKTETLGRTKIKVDSTTKVEVGDATTTLTNTDININGDVDINGDLDVNGATIFTEATAFENNVNITGGNITINNDPAETDAQIKVWVDANNGAKTLKSEIRLGEINTTGAIDRYFSGFMRYNEATNITQFGTTFDDTAGNTTERIHIEMPRDTTRVDIKGDATISGDFTNTSSNPQLSLASNSSTYDTILDVKTEYNSGLLRKAMLKLRDSTNNHGAILSFAKNSLAGAIDYFQLSVLNNLTEVPILQAIRDTTTSLYVGAKNIKLGTVGSSNTPLASIQIPLVQSTFNGTTNLTFVALPDNKSDNRIRRLQVPYKYTLTGISFICDDDNYTGYIQVVINRYSTTYQMGTVLDFRVIQSKTFGGTNDRADAKTFTPMSISTDSVIGCEISFSNSGNTKETNIILWGYQENEF